MIGPSDPEKIAFAEAHEVGEEINREIRHAGNMATYLYDLERTKRGLHITTMSKACSALVEPLDRALQQQISGGEIGGVFFRGSLLGIRAAELLLPQEMKQVLNNTDVRLSVVSVDHVEDKFDKVDIVGRGIMEKAGRALAGWESFDGFREEWEAQITPDIRHQRFASHGFGLALSLMDDAVAAVTQKADLQAFEQAIAEPVDWDAALTKMTNES